MPSTLTGLLLFLTLLLPGFIFVTTLRRERPENRPSALKETATIVAASVVSELFVLGVFAVISALARSWTPDIGQLIAKPQDYLVVHYLRVFEWTVGLFVAACSVAWVAALVIRRRPAPPSGMSAWWLLFEQYRQGRHRHVGVMLDDGSYLQGQLISYNDSADDSPDRDLVLMAPITYRHPKTTETTELDCGAACVSARHIVAMTIAYVPAPANPSRSPLVAGGQAATAASPG
ncbi:DUF6338 family protein [Amycolatopsis dongchuanensis]|uniref:Uncharacterized protein n=1 Tax=Amycolatopsis dongchuanensis TaxID=1070866 RepID=A0ABP9Q0T2_9PSEU